jgi:NAD(P)-dependent dehydrogenase (short-subunit alcohol dehydrogenase family)
MILSLQVRFPRPAFYPTTVRVGGKIGTLDSARGAATVDVVIEDLSQNAAVLMCKAIVSLRATAGNEGEMARQPVAPPRPDRPRILVTGSAGRLARRLLPALAESHDILGISRSAQPGTGWQTAQCDLEDQAALDSLLATHSPAEFFAILHLSSPPANREFLSDNVDATRRQLWHALDLPLQLTRWARQAGSAVQRIVLLGSHAGRKHPDTALGAYSLAKAAEEELVRFLAVEFGVGGGTVNIVTPSRLDVFDTGQSGASGVPTGRLSTAGDVAGVISFLLSDTASQVNGAVIAVDGGLP